MDCPHACALEQQHCLHIQLLLPSLPKTRATQRPAVISLFCDLPQMHLL